MNTSQPNDLRQRLEEVFSGYRAEWLDKRIFELFTEPSYFPQLTTPHPCFLEGGRGTGKTTTLRCLSYQGQAVLRRSYARAVPNWPYVGMYYRVNTNRVRAFNGSELQETHWTRMFAHYVNVEFCEAIAAFLQWYAERNPDTPTLSKAGLCRIAETLHLDHSNTLEEFRRTLDLSKLKFEATVNNIADVSLPALSMQGAPVDAFMREVKKLPQFESSSFFFLIDEYENLATYQQRVLNTLIKHCGESYSFKVGVRELGFKERSTINTMEKLTHPADYRLINITKELEERQFSSFAADVCKRRLEQVLGPDVIVPTPNKLLPELSPEDEAIKLGVKEALETEDLQNEIADDEELKNWCSNAHPLEIFVLTSRAQAEGMSNTDKLRDVLVNPDNWAVQFDNYKHCYLFVIRKGKRGTRKYFTGWRVFCLLSASNIRYLLELVDQSLKRHFEGLDLDPLKAISHEIQTKVAQDTGQKYLRELEGISLNGAKLTRLLLSLGRVFQVMAEDPVGHTPEVNQFRLKADVEDKKNRRRVEELVADGIMNLALLRHPGSKLQEQTDIRQFDYTIHPIFAAFFGFSHRRKRKIALSDRDILDLVDHPTDAIGRIVNGQNRTGPFDGLDELPEQMKLFEGFYATDK